MVLAFPVIGLEFCFVLMVFFGGGKKFSRRVAFMPKRVTASLRSFVLGRPFWVSFSTPVLAK